MQRAKPGKGPHLSLEPSSPEDVSEAPSTPERTALPNGLAMHLDIDDVEELRAAIERSLCEGEMLDSSDSVVDDELRRSLRVACAKARLQRVRAEHVIVDLKLIWTTFPSMLTTRTSERLSEIVTACIAEYYAKDDFISD
jgi:hypothetical protein